MTLNTHRRARACAAPSAKTANCANSAKAVTAFKAVTAKSRSRRAVQQLVCTAALVALAAAIPMSSAFAQGIPVLDTANLVSAIQRLLARAVGCSRSWTMSPCNALVGVAHGSPGAAARAVAGGVG
ncbi:MAG: hypothetical protein LW854_22985, partial [Rubrivivax sp.]|nr:hypothetical protein [Rubrivivax sp.]